jgi:hypothetical protein
MARLSDRPTTDLLILLIAGTICVSVLAAGATVGIVEVVHPETDTSAAVSAISDVINTLIGLLAGFLAGRTDAVQTALREHRQQQQEASRADVDH